MYVSTLPRRERAEHSPKGEEPMSLLNREKAEMMPEEPPQALIDVDFIQKRPAAFALSRGGDWETAKRMFECLAEAGLGEEVSLRIRPVEHSDQLSIGIEVEDSGGSLGALFEKTGHVFTLLEKKQLLEGIVMWS